MLPRHPIFYLSLPGVALVIGLAWLYRKRSSGDGRSLGDIKDNKICQINKSKKDQNKTKQNTPSLEIVARVKCDSDTIAYNLGKSAPIDITNGKPSPVFLSDKQIDTEILKMKISNSEMKSLRSIQEDNEFMSPDELPDSVAKEKFYFTRTISPNQNEEPIIIKATVAAKISPKNSFLESAYTDKCEADEKLVNITAVQIVTIENKASGSTENKDETSNLVNCSVEEQNKIDPTVSVDEDTKDTNISNDNNTIPASPENNNTKQTAPAPQRISSPPLSLCSIQSGDSGKGSSPPHSECTPATLYDFLLPSSLVGQLTGYKNVNIKEIKAKTAVVIVIKKHPMSSKIKICTLKGNQNDINAALLLIREKLPEKRYPNLTLQRVHFATPQSIVPLTSSDRSCFQLELIEGINNDVVVSSIVSGGHVFVQQPLHPTYPSLHVMQSYLNQSYSTNEAPLLPNATIGAICVGKVGDYWYRLQIVNYNKDIQMCDVKFIDFGGYTSIAPENLRQINADFMTLPFQAVECLLSNIKPIDSEWSYESMCVLRQLTGGVVLQAQVAGYNPDNIPEIYLYACLSSNNVIFINQELVARRLARWIDNSELIA